MCVPLGALYQLRLNKEMTRLCDQRASSPDGVRFALLLQSWRALRKHAQLARTQRSLSDRLIADMLTHRTRTRLNSWRRRLHTDDEVILPM